MQLLHFFEIYETEILFTISVSAFLMSLWQFIHEYLRSRVKLSVSVTAFEEHPYTNSTIYRFYFINSSSRSIVISSVAFLPYDGKSILCYHSHQWCGERYYPKFPETDITITERKLSLDFPIIINPDSSVSGLVKFKIDDKSLFDLETRNFIIHTHRKNIKYTAKYCSKLKTDRI